MFAQLAGASDVMAVATFDLRIDDRPYKVTHLPALRRACSRYLVAAAAPAPVSDRERAKRTRPPTSCDAQFERSRSTSPCAPEHPGVARRAR